MKQKKIARYNVISVRVTNEEYKQITSYCIASGKSVSMLLRKGIEKWEKQHATNAKEQADQDIKRIIIKAG